MILTVSTCASPLGPLRLYVSPAGLCRLALPGEPEMDAAVAAWLARFFPGPTEAREAARREHDLFHDQLAEYFAGQRRAFDLPLDLRGTPFQRRVWGVLLNIGWGETRSYGEVAGLLGSPGAARAVGQACGANPVAIVVPCHRVVAAGGRPGGYSGGAGVKRFLLALEGG